ncbi:hypothetical protein H5410_061971 [Solanum commersonii]|uniref:Uncharacterized protein n=1 Tax=Solanum commersonii TaxID=4109 RepID=A0A9J5W9E8_SOLCO|nr:hypothetical protein H5410_061971 [Solanum commersonii]
MRTDETTITMQDMEVMFGMVVDGTSVLLPNAKSMDLFARQTLIFNLTGWFPTENCFQGFRIFSPSLVNYIETSNVINDNSTELEFIWEPYSQEVLNALSEWCRRGHNVWMVKMFVHTENTWNECYQHVVQINHQANPIDYFNWYLRHSCKFIANLEHVVQHGYQPIAGKYEALAMGHEILYRMNQTIENDNTQSFQVRDNARQMTSYSRDAMNAAHLNTRLNFQQHYTPPNENQSPTTSNSGGVHIEEHNTEFSRNQYEANTNLSLATPDTPYYPIFYCAGVSTSVPNYTEEEGSGFQTPNVVNLGFEGFNEGNYGFV